ncbi:MFS transporter [Pigmentiphaga litoralis]|uniref:MFS transporter n=1 Tax=Pigmentiphaga litoralis TaxID=516702 RepID=UPI001677FB57|nr:MFS transporter [Pigmentiphaga litoralis]GGX00699.1 MFS transporter [Pigmentiphaga litoralis]
MQQVLRAPGHRYARRHFDWKVITLVGIAHASSHFFQLVIPSLYVPLSLEFGLSFAELGAVVAVFYALSGLGQAASGFAVDRFGAKPMLWFGLGNFVLAGCVLGAAQGYLWLLAAAAIAGMGNAVFHPVDFSILNRRVSAPRLGHAFSAHGITGNLGWAATPVFIATLTYFFSWRIAAFGAALLLAAVLAMTVIGRRLLTVDVVRPVVTNDSAIDAAAGVSASATPRGGADLPARPVPAKAAGGGSLKALVSSPVLWGAFLFFLCTSAALSAVQNYTVPLLGSLYGITTVAASTALSGYMVGGAIGMVGGGFLVSAGPHSEKIVAGSFLAAGGILALIALQVVPSSFAVPLVVLAGMCAGVAGPSRDMLVRKVAPKGATGSVYGLVYSGMDTGSALAPLAFGALFDAGLRQAPYFGALLAFLVAAGLAAWIASRARASAGAPAESRAGATA